jgi:hypothetical protein
MTRSTIRVAFLLSLSIIVTGGCARLKPWDRDLLAEKKMRFNGLAHENAVDEHVYFSKEGSTGGQRAAGGGCGCN